jgi:hypothetical protein
MDYGNVGVGGPAQHDQLTYIMGDKPCKRVVDKQRSRRIPEWLGLYIHRIRISKLAECIYHRLYYDLIKTKPSPYVQHNVDSLSPKINYHCSQTKKQRHPLISAP